MFIVFENFHPMEKCGKCTLCKEIPNIKINKLNYCNECFYKVIEMKCHKHLRKLPFKSKILLVLKRDISSTVLCNILSKYKNKAIHLFSIFHIDEEIQNDGLLLQEYNFPEIGKNKYDKKVPSLNLSELKVLDSTEIQKIVEITNPEGLYDRIIKNEIDYVFYHTDVEEQSMQLFKRLCNGANLTNSLNPNISYTTNNRSVHFVNLFQEIKSKEIVYYAYLNNLRRDPSRIKQPLRGYDSVIQKFVNKIDRDNSLALFNVINTVKKL